MSHGEDEEVVMVSKKQGVAHAEASFLGGREKQNGIVDVQWEKGVKKSSPYKKLAPTWHRVSPGMGPVQASRYISWLPLCKVSEFCS